MNTSTFARQDAIEAARRDLTQSERDAIAATWHAKQPTAAELAAKKQLDMEAEIYEARKAAYEGSDKKTDAGIDADAMAAENRVRRAYGQQTSPVELKLRD